MATLTAIATAYSQNSVTVTNPSNAYTDTSSSTYASLPINSTSDWVKFSGFDFSSIPTGSIINSVTFKIKVQEYSGSIAIQLAAFINNSQFSYNTTSSSSAVVVTLSNSGTPTLAQLKAAAANNYFKIYIINLSSNVTVYVYGMEIIVDYTPVYAITSSAGSNGSISPDGTTYVSSGSNQEYTISPNSGYELDVLTVDGSAASPTTTTPSIAYLFTNVTTTHTISATFKSSYDIKYFFHAQYKQAFGGN